MNAAAHNARLPLAFITPGNTVLLAELGPEIDPNQREDRKSTRLNSSH